jgi:hypothetical protein
LFDLLEDILIITNEGKVIVRKIKNPQIEEIFFSNLVRALNTFCENFAHEQLNQFEFSNFRFDIIKKGNLFFIGSSLKTTKHKKVLRILQRIIDIFAEKYKNERLNSLEENPKIFQEIEEYINKTRDEIIIDMLFTKK